MDTIFEDAAITTYPQMPWMVDFAYISKQAQKPVHTKNTAQSICQFDFLCNLNLQQKTLNTCLTNLICHIDCEITNADLLSKLLEAGVSAFCIDISKGTTESNIKLFDNIQHAIMKYNKTQRTALAVPILLELQGFRIQTGHLKTPLEMEPKLNEGDVVFLTVKDEFKMHCDCNIIYVNYKEILDEVCTNDLIYINYGQIILQILAVDLKRERIRCLTLAGGKLENEASIHIPDAALTSVESKQPELIKFGLKFSIDCFIISHSRNAYQIENIRSILREEHRNEVLLFARIEECQGVENIDEILEVSDGIVIARDELGIMLPPAKLFLIQKSIAAKCNKVGKPVIIAAQFLHSMKHRQVPTKSEIFDVANATLDGADSLTMCEDIAKGNHALECIEMMINIRKEAEASIHYPNLHKFLHSQLCFPAKGAYSIAMSAVDTAVKCSASCIIVITRTGRSAKLIAQYKPYCPIIAITRIGHVARKLRLWRAIISLHYLGMPHESWMKDIQCRFDYGLRYGKATNMIKASDAIVLVNGSRNDHGFSNTLKVVYASTNNCRPVKL